MRNLSMRICVRISFQRKDEDFILLYLCSHPINCPECVKIGLTQTNIQITKTKFA